MIRPTQLKKATHWFSVLFAFVLLSVSATAEIEVGVRISKNPIPFGESSMLTISVSGTQRATPPQLVSNNMLDIAYRGASSSTSIVNGAMSSSIDFNYVLQPKKLGKFMIPPISLEVDGETYVSEELVIEIVKSSEKALDVTTIAQLELDLPKRPLYVGETFPSELRMLMLNDASFPNRALPISDADAFSLTNLDPQNVVSSRTILNGQYWDVFSWEIAITPVKAGEKLLEYSASHTIRVQDRSTNRDPYSIFSNDPFFRSSFGNYTDKQIVSKTTDEPITVLPLPTEGAPENFTGAIGEFTFQVEALTTELNEGDPITLSIIIQGEGNFSQMTPPVFSGGEDFKSYPPIVKSESLDTLEYAGTKTFEYVIIPRSADITEIPSITLAYFNPDTASYKISESTPIPLTITAATRSANTLPSVNHLETPIRTSTQIDPNQLLPIKIALPDLTTRPTLERVKRTLISSIVAPVFLLSLFHLIRKGRESSRKDEEKARIKVLDLKINLHRADMKKARRNNKSTEFYEASCRILQAALAKQLGCNPDAITGKEIDALWVQSLGSDSTKQTIHSFFNKVDALRYSGGAIEPGVLASEEQEIESILSSMGKKK